MKTYVNTVKDNLKPLWCILALAVMTTTVAAYAQDGEIKYTDLTNLQSRSGEYSSYIAKDGSVYNVGDRLTIGLPSSNNMFAFIWEGDGILITPTNVGAVLSGNETEIKRIYIGGNKRSGFQVWFRTKGLTGLANYSIQIEKAIETGEIKSFGMSSDEALAELKKAKDKLDLGLIDQQKYDSLKVALSQYIK